MKPVTTLAAVLAALLLSACAEKAQTAATKRSDGKPWEAAQSAYAAPGWKTGDAASWEEQMKTRAQNQNEYSRAAAQP